MGAAAIAVAVASPASAAKFVFDVQLHSVSNGTVANPVTTADNRSFQFTMEILNFTAPPPQHSDTYLTPDGQYSADVSQVFTYGPSLGDTPVTAELKTLAAMTDPYENTQIQILRTAYSLNGIPYEEFVDFSGYTLLSQTTTLTTATLESGAIRPILQQKQAYALTFYRTQVHDPEIAAITGRSFNDIADIFELMGPMRFNEFGRNQVVDLTNYFETPVSEDWRSYDGIATFNRAASQAIPEPATWAMMVIGFGGVGAAVRRCRRQHLHAA